MGEPELIHSLAVNDKKMGDKMSFKPIDWRTLFVGVLLIAGVLATLWSWPKDKDAIQRESVAQAAKTNAMPAPIPLSKPIPLDSSYEAARSSLEAERQALSQRFGSTSSAGERTAILQEAHRVFAEGISLRLAPWWMGTPWDFNGITQTPGEGKIACGYFVSTLLLHAGLQVERVRMAQQASEHIIQSLVGSDALVKGHGLPLAKFIERLRTRGNGLYVVGLDSHTGFLWNDGTDIWFIHSNFAGPRCVVQELASESAVLNASNYRIAGYLSGNDAIMEAWLTGKKIATKMPVRPGS